VRTTPLSLSSPTSSSASGCARIRVPVRSLGWAKLNCRTGPLQNTEITAGLICFFLAAAHVWTLEHRKYISEVERNYPKLQGEIKQYVFGDVAGHPSMFVVVRIRNLGADSIVEDYSVTALLDHRTFSGMVMKLPRYINLDTRQLFTSADSLYNKTGEVPIQRGSQKTGVLWARFDSVKQSDLERCTFLIRYSDINGKVYTVNSKDFPYAGHEFKTFPGLTSAN
ncbi:MAG TPA: hypothetical protein VGL97_05580, partial [Bryobacteraceae bacterium]